MPAGVYTFVLLLLFGLAFFAAGYAVARRSGLGRERELSEKLIDTAARYRAAVQKQPDASAPEGSGESEESEAEQWKSAYETMLQSFDSMKDAYESMKQAAESYEQASDSNRRAYEDMKAAYEGLRDSIKEHEGSAPR
jgi:chromosome segregation ATPase